MELAEEAGEERLVPVARDLVERQTEEVRLLVGDVEPDDGDRCEAEPARGDEPLVAADDDRVRTPGDDRLDEAEAPDAPLECIER